MIIAILRGLCFFHKTYAITNSKPRIGDLDFVNIIISIHNGVISHQNLLSQFRVQFRGNNHVYNRAKTANLEVMFWYEKIPMSRLSDLEIAKSGMTIASITETINACSLMTF